VAGGWCFVCMGPALIMEMNHVEVHHGPFLACFRKGVIFGDLLALMLSCSSPQLYVLCILQMVHCVRPALCCYGQHLGSLLACCFLFHSLFVLFVFCLCPAGQTKTRQTPS